MALIFPVPEWNKTSYKEGMRQFGWRRKGGRLHAGCDIYAPLRSPVKTIAAGKIVESGGFYNGTDQIAIDHGAGIGIVRYGEIYREKGMDVGVDVGAGVVIGYIGHLVGMKVHPMLHLEQYDGSGAGKLSITDKKAAEPTHYNIGVEPTGRYRRRADLMNPTPLLDRIILENK